MPRAAFAIVVLLNGLNAVAIRFTVAELPPFWGGALRFAAAALFFWAAAVWQREPWPGRRVLGLALLYGALMFGLSSAFVYWSLDGMAAGPMQVIIGLTPLLTLLLAIVHRQERLSPWAGAGAALAVAGVALAYTGGAGGFVPGPALAALAGALCMAEATTLAGRLGRGRVWQTNAVAMTAGVVVLLAAAAVAGEPVALPRRPATWLALVYLVALGSIGLYLLFLYVVAHWPASAAAYVFVLAPLVTVVASAALEGAPVTGTFLLGAAIALAGVWLGAIRNRRDDLQTSNEK
jgi:drug/metabolite transporter (DMT)-like permease